MSDNITIEIGTPQDSLGITIVRRETWLSTYPNKEVGITREDIENKLNLRTIDEDVKRLNERISNDSSSRAFVAKNGEKIIGFILVVKGKVQNKVRAFYILSEFQGQGIGGRLMNKALEWLGNDKDLALEVADYNMQAINFYKKFGFVENGVASSPAAKLSDGKEIPEIIMVKKF